MNKSTKLRIAAKLVGVIGVLACLIGCAVYCVLCMPEVLNLPFSWLGILIDFVMLAVCVFVAVMLNVAANSAEAEEMMALEAATAAEAAAAAAEAAAREAEAQALAEAEAAAEAAARAEAEAAAAEKQATLIGQIRAQIPEETLAKIDRVVEVVKANTDVLVPAAVVCTAAVVVAKARKERKRAKMRNAFFKLFG